MYSGTFSFPDSNFLRPPLTFSAFILAHTCSYFFYFFKK